jgi:transcriptional regulator with XRE-family HTH domain
LRRPINEELNRQNHELRRQLVAEPPRDWLTAEETADLAGVSAATIRNWCRLERIGTFDKCWKINRAHLRRYLTDRFGAARLPAALRD